MTTPDTRPPRLIPFAKLADQQARRLIAGFARGEPLGEMAAATGVSVKTCRSVIRPLRYRLLRAPFHAFTGWPELHKLPEAAEHAIYAHVFGLFAKCHFNRRCYSNFAQGRRAERLCRSCPLQAIYDIGDEEDLHALDLALAKLDWIHDFYRTLDLGGERDILPLTCFRLRLWHTLAVTQACANSRKSEDGTIDLDEDAPETAAHLYRLLLRDLESEPLRREMGPIDAMDAKYGDLTWLER